MGGKSDINVIYEVAAVLKEFGITYESAHSASDRAIRSADR
jgi:phosphoribosylcarboxyaminoimidazole (NCAIR) mutase